MIHSLEGYTGWTLNFYSIYTLQDSWDDEIFINRMFSLRREKAVIYQDNNVVFPSFSPSHKKDKYSN